MIKDRGQILRKTRSAIRRMKVQAKSELNISVLLLPERHKLTPYYQTLSSEVYEKQKALAMRWKFEKIRQVGRHANTNLFIDYSWRFDRSEIRIR